MRKMPYRLCPTLDHASRLPWKPHLTVSLWPPRFLLTPYSMTKLIILTLMVTIPLKVILLTSSRPIGAWKCFRETAEASDLTSLTRADGFHFWTSGLHAMQLIISRTLRVPYHCKCTKCIASTKINFYGEANWTIQALWRLWWRFRGWSKRHTHLPQLLQASSWPTPNSVLWSQRLWIVPGAMVKEEPRAMLPILSQYWGGLSTRSQ